MVVVVDDDDDDDDVRLAVVVDAVAVVDVVRCVVPCNETPMVDGDVMGNPFVFGIICVEDGINN